MPSVYNFSPGPAMLPAEVMQQAQAEFLNWNGTGVSAMELSHRGADFKKLAAESLQDLRDLLKIPDNYHVLFLPGGGRGQMACVPLNLLGDNAKAAYLDTGVWSDIAINEARSYCDPQVVVSTRDNHYISIPAQDSWADFSEAAYLYYVDNETVNGVEFPYIPNSKGVPLVCDMSSNLLSREFDVSQYGLFYACAQKMLGPAGVTVVVIRDDLLQRKVNAATPSIFNYKLQVEKESMLNTSPTYSWYMVSLVLKWMKSQGGVSELERRAQACSNLLYNCIDQNDFYLNTVDPSVRSRINVIFNLANKDLDDVFLKESTEAGLLFLKGHRFVGGMRASMYGGMPYEGVKVLVDFMNQFSKRHG